MTTQPDPAEVAAVLARIPDRFAEWVAAQPGYQHYDQDALRAAWDAGYDQACKEA